jgi:hypothetical protein
MHWGPYEVLSVLSGIAMMCLAFIPDPKTNAATRLAIVLLGALSAGYGYYVAEQTSGIYYFDVRMFALPFVVLAVFGWKAYERRTGPRAVPAGLDRLPTPPADRHPSLLPSSAAASTAVPAQPAATLATGPRTWPFCPQCGTASGPRDGFCGSCGESLTIPEDTPTPPGPTAAAVPDAAPLAPALSDRLPQLPLELIAVLLLMAVTGAGLGFVALRALPNAIALAFGSGAYGVMFGSLFLLFELGALTVGAGLVVLAVKLTRADKVARILALVVLGVAAGGELFGGDLSGWRLLTLLLSAGGLAALAFAPAVNTFFASHAGPDYGQPNAVVASRALLVCFNCGLMLAGVTMLVGITLGARFFFYAAMMFGLASTGFVLGGRLRQRSLQARLRASVLGGAAALLFIWGLNTSALSLVPLGLVAVQVGLLWLPAESKAFFELDSRRPE